MKPIKDIAQEYQINNRAKIQVEAETNRIGFIYEIDDSMECSFDLLSEVGQPYQQQFKDFLNRFNWKIDIAETETDYYNVLVTSTDTLTEYAVVDDSEQGETVLRTFESPE